MPAIKLFKYSTSSPQDVTPLAQLTKDTGFKSDSILAVIGKSEGNGCVNDFSRTLSALVWEQLIPSDAVTVFSGGTEGVLSPHVNFIVESSEPTGLVAAVGHTRLLSPEEVGTSVQADEVAKTVATLLSQNSMDPADVHLVLIKCPLLTSDKIESIKAKGLAPATVDTYHSMALSRLQCAVGIRAALKEETGDVWSAKASCSSGAELDDCHIFILANDPKVAKPILKAHSGFMKDAIDAKPFFDALKAVEKDNGKLVQVFAKAEADPTGLIRNKRHIMNTDSDIHSTRHARAAVGGLLAGLSGMTDIYVSGGAEGQGPDGGGSLCVVYEL